MQEEQNSQKIAYKCSIHNKLVSAFSIATQNKFSDRLLCTKCLVGQSCKGVAIKQLIYLDDFIENPLKEILKFSENDLQFDNIFEQLQQQIKQFEKQILQYLNMIESIIYRMKSKIKFQKCSLDPQIEEFKKILREDTLPTQSIQAFLDHLSYDIKNFHFKTKININEKINMKKIQDLVIDFDEDLAYLINGWSDYSLSQILHQKYLFKPYVNSLQDINSQSYNFVLQFQNKIQHILYNPFEKSINEFYDFPRIHELISNERQIYYQLLYQGTFDGLNAQSYWKNCDKQENLLTIIYLADGNIVGGFSPCQLNMNEQNYIRDDKMKSFLYSVNKKEIYPIKQSEFAVRCRPTSGPTYGAGHDLAILDDFKRVFSNLGNSYDMSQIENIQNNHLLGDDPVMIECLVYKIIYM